jgi:4-aminobutyrate aminotransferase-like enzyme
METKDLYDEYMITSMVAGFDPVEVESAEGTRVHCRSGKTYLDCFSGISVVNAGHRHPKVIAAAKEQLDKLVHCCTYVYYSPQAGRVAKLLAEITPGATSSWPSPTASTAAPTRRSPSRATAAARSRAAPSCRA